MLDKVIVDTGVNGLLDRKLMDRTNVIDKINETCGNLNSHWDNGNKRFYLNYNQYDIDALKENPNALDFISELVNLFNKYRVEINTTNFTWQSFIFEQNKKNETRVGVHVIEKLINRF